MILQRHRQTDGQTDRRHAIYSALRSKNGHTCTEWQQAMRMTQSINFLPSANSQLAQA